MGRYMSEFDRVSGKPGVPEYEVVQFVEKQHKAALVIPILNEGDRIRGQLERLAAAHVPADVWIADGGSTDGATETSWLAAHNVTGLMVKHGPGKLSAQLRMAMAHVVGLGYEYVVTMDGNGKDGVEGVERIVEALDAGYGFVQGSRFVPGGVAINTPPSRLYAIKFLHAPLTSFGAGTRYTDTTNGFRGHSVTLLTDSRVAPFRDVFDSYELLAYLPIRAARLGYRVTEVPVSRSYPASGQVPTKIHGVAGSKLILSILWRAVRHVYDPQP